jgi:uncharacterized protein
MSKVGANGEGKVTPLEPGQLWVMRIRALAGALVVVAAAAIAGQALHDELGLPRSVLLLPLAPVLLYWVLIRPGRAFRAWGYSVDPVELQVRQGIFTQTHTIVPLDRVQHIDISQGPLERAFAVCRLVLHTAGTMHSLVVVPGLARGTAERIRDEIRVRVAQSQETE